MGESRKKQVTVQEKNDENDILVEDALATARNLTRLLCSEGFAVEYAANRQGDFSFRTGIQAAIDVYQQPEGNYHEGQAAA